MASQALRGCTGISRGVAACTRNRNMRAGQREISQIVVQISRFPRSRRVAHGAFRREPGGSMVWIRRAGIIIAVAGKACRRRSGVSARVATITVDADMGAC